MSLAERACEEATRAAEIQRRGDLLRRVGLSTSSGDGLESLWEYDLCSVKPAVGAKPKAVLDGAILDLVDALGGGGSADAMAQAAGRAYGVLNGPVSRLLGEPLWSEIKDALRNLYNTLQASGDRDDGLAALPMSYQLSISTDDGPRPIRLLPQGDHMLGSLFARARSAVAPTAFPLGYGERDASPWHAEPIAIDVRLPHLLRGIESLRQYGAITCDREDVPTVAATLLAVSRREGGDLAALDARVRAAWNAASR